MNPLELKLNRNKALKWAEFRVYHYHWTLTEVLSKHVTAYIKCKMILIKRLAFKVHPLPWPSSKIRPGL